MLESSGEAAMGYSLRIIELPTLKICCDRREKQVRKNSEGNPGNKKRNKDELP